jgi:hypothetical protein
MEDRFQTGNGGRAAPVPAPVTWGQFVRSIWAWLTRSQA